MGYFDKKSGFDEKPESGKDRGREPVIVHKPRNRGDAYLTAKGGLKWDKEHLDRWEGELR